MRNSTIKIKTGQCLDCPPGRTTFLTADRCPSHYKIHRANISASRKAERQEAEPAGTITIQPKNKTAKPRVTNLFNLSQPRLLKLAEEAVNAYIRERDWKGDHFECVSCKKKYARSHMHAGHFYSVGGHSYTRFNEDNINGQCISCNSYKGGNLLPYRKNLIKKIGQERVEELEKWCKYSKSWSKLELVAIIQLYREKIKKDFL